MAWWPRELTVLPEELRLGLSTVGGWYRNSIPGDPAPLSSFAMSLHAHRKPKREEIKPMGEEPGSIL